MLGCLRNWLIVLLLIVAYLFLSISHNLYTQAKETARILDGPESQQRRMELYMNPNTPEGRQKAKATFDPQIRETGTFGAGALVLSILLLVSSIPRSKKTSSRAPKEPVTPVKLVEPPDPVAVEQRALQQRLAAEQAARERAEKAAEETRKRAAEQAERERLEALERERRDHSKIPDSEW